MIDSAGSHEYNVPVVAERDRSVVVVIPYYNGSQWIERALKSVFAQTVPVDEVIVVNDGSKPAERETLGQLASRYAFRILDKPNGGQGSARNAGVAASTCAFISFLDQDDFYLTTHNEDLLAGIPDHDPRLGWVYADLCEGDGDGNIVHSHMLRHYKPNANPKRGYILGLLRDDLFILPSASLIRRDAYEAVGGFDEQFTGYEDDDLFLRLFRAGYTNHFLETPVTVWCRHMGSTSWTLKMSTSRMRYFKKLAAMFPDDPTLENFYFRDGLVRRFEPMFVWDVERAVEQDDPNLPAFQDILVEYTRMVLANPTVSAGHKLKLHIKTEGLTRVPPPAIRALKRVTHLPGVRGVMKRLWAL